MKSKTFFNASGSMLLLSFVLICSCTKSDMVSESQRTTAEMSNALESRSSAYSNEFYALTDANVLVKYSAGFPVREISSYAISGLMDQERLLAIDFRPATGQLYSVSNQSRLYLLNVDNGKASAISATPFSPAINGDEVGFDFNPTVDRIRLVTSNDQDLRLHPETGQLAAIDGDINPSMASITAVAYTNSFAGASTTTLYDIDRQSKKLFTQTPANSGTLIEVGPLGVDFTGEGGFDISSDNTLAMAVLMDSKAVGPYISIDNHDSWGFYEIDLKTGSGKYAGKAKRKIIGLAIPTQAVAYAVDQMNNLMIFNPFTNSAIVSKTITGLAMGEQIQGIDMRPVTGELYALGSSSRIYTLNMSSGAATAVGGQFTTLLEGTSFGFDFNPTVDRIRVVSNTGQNLRVHPTTGAVAAIDGSLNPGTPSVDAVAYTNSQPGATTTTLYDIDFQNDILYKQVPANSGTLEKVGHLGINASAGNGFDIGGQSNRGYGIFTFYDKVYVFKVNINVGYADISRSFPKKVNGFAIGLGF